jgi:superfamily II DNA/RNA helicase
VAIGTVLLYFLDSTNRALGICVKHTLQKTHMQKVQAPSGSEKTIALLLPAAAHIVGFGHGRHSQLEAPLALFLSPTRELALQMLQAAKPHVHLLGLRTVCVYGGEAKKNQLQQISCKPHMLVATPGRYAASVHQSSVLRRSFMPTSAQRPIYHSHTN